MNMDSPEEGYREPPKEGSGLRGGHYAILVVIAVVIIAIVLGTR